MGKKGRKSSSKRKEVENIVYGDEDENNTGAAPSAPPQSTAHEPSERERDQQKFLA